MINPVYDYVIIGSGFGGSVSAMRLTEKGYRVLVLERGKRFQDHDFAKSNWDVRKYLWAPPLRWFGILQISPFRNVLVLHGSGVGGGSLGYANVLQQPDDASFAQPAWQQPLDWKAALRPHYETAKRMLGVATNPRLWPADEALREIAAERGREDSFRPVTTGTFFGSPGVEVPDPYFGGEGPARRGCIHCGGCMVGCRHNAKNTLVKNYLYLAEKWGAEVRAEAEVRDIRPLLKNQSDGARYEVVYRHTGRLTGSAVTHIRARNVIVAAGALGTLRLLFRCKQTTRSLPKLSPHLGDNVRTNSESLLGSTSRTLNVDYSTGIAITSIFNADDVTTIEPVRYPAGSSLMKFLAGPMTSGRSLIVRFLQSLAQIILKLPAFMNVQFGGSWAERTTILLVMQHEDNKIRMRLGRSPFTFFRRNLVSLPDEQKSIPTQIESGHEVARQFADKTGGVRAGVNQRGAVQYPDYRAHPRRRTLWRGRERGRHCRRLPRSQLPRPVRDRRLDCPGQSRRQPQPDHHRDGRIRHEPGITEVRGCKSDAAPDGGGRKRNWLKYSTSVQQNGISEEQGTMDTMSRYVRVWLAKSIALAIVVSLLSCLSVEAQTVPLDTVTQVEWSPDGTRIATSNFKNKVEVWDAQSGELLFDLVGHASYIGNLAWSPDGMRLASASSDETTRIWNTTTGQLLFTLEGHGEGVVGIAWSVDGTQVITGTGGVDVNPYLRVWDAATGKLLREVSASIAGAMVWSPDGQMLATSGVTSVQLRNGTTFEPVNTLAQNQKTDFEQDYEITSVAWHPDGSQVATGYLNGKLRIWDINTGRVLAEYQANESPLDHIGTSAVRALDWWGDGIRLTGVSGDGTIRTWNTETGEVEETINVGERNYDADFSPFGGRLALGGVPHNDLASAAMLSNSATLMQTFADGAVRIVVPNPSLERLQAIAHACNAPSVVGQALPASDTASQISAFVNQVEALPQDAIPASCAADLIAVANALQSKL